MKHFLLFLFVTFIFTGCAVQGEYKKEYISKHLNTFLSKVNNEEATVVFSNQVLEKNPSTLRGSAVKINMHTGQIITDVQTEFFREYFKNVNVSNNVSKKGLTLESEVLDYNYHYMLFADNVEMTTKIKVSFYKDGIKKFTKIYETTDNTNVLLTFGAVSPTHNAIELFHKQLLKLFDTEVKKDMIYNL